MIVAPQLETVEVGLTILAAGGSAMDAALACAFTEGVVGLLICGTGGLGSLQVFDPKSGQHVVLDGLSTCPAACLVATFSCLTLAIGYAAGWAIRPQVARLFAINETATV